MDPIRTPFMVFWQNAAASNKPNPDIQALMTKNLIFLAQNQDKLTYEDIGAIRTRIWREDYGLKGSCSVAPENLPAFCKTVEKFSSYPFFNTQEINKLLPSVKGAMDGLNKLKVIQYSLTTPKKTDLLNDSIKHLDTGAKELEHLLLVIQSVEKSISQNPYAYFDTVAEDIAAKKLDQKIISDEEIRLFILDLTHKYGFINKPSEKTAIFEPAKQTPWTAKFKDTALQLLFILNQLPTLQLSDRERYLATCFIRNYELNLAINDAQKQLDDLYMPLEPQNSENEEKIITLKEGFTDEQAQEKKQALANAEEALKNYHQALAKFVNIFSSPAHSRKQFKELGALFESEFTKFLGLAEIYEDLTPKAVESNALVVQNALSTSSLSQESKRSMGAIAASAFVATGAMVGSTLCPPAAPFLISGSALCISGIGFVAAKGAEGVAEAMANLKPEDLAQGANFLTKVAEAYKTSKQPEAEAPPAAHAKESALETQKPKEPKVEKALTDDES